VSSLPIRRLQFFTIRTKNLAAAREFYVDKLGFPTISEKAGEFFQVSVAGVPVCVDLSKDNPPAQPNQIGIEVTDLDTTMAMLRKKGFVIREGSRAAGTERWAAIQDPDGHELIFIAG
jgi:catechol 2,3-dioxygenase-like lactoylglutathione lyase family enzyme